MGLAALAAGCAAWASLRQGAPGLAAAALMAGVLVLGNQARNWTQSRNAPRRWVQARPGGRLQLRLEDGAAYPLRLRPSTRILGPSVFLDADCEMEGRPLRLSVWLTPWDLPRDTLRLWTIVLLSGGRVARS
jgi:hypothetical protein